jgi:hypothetical protein
MTFSAEQKMKVVEELVQYQPLMPVEVIRQEFLNWLQHLRFPFRSEPSSWDDSLRVIRADADDEKLISGRRIRLALCLFTRTNRYLISVLENLAPSARGVYTVAVHVDWTREEWHKQRRVDTTYCGGFDDALRARHVIWAEPFRQGGLGHALDAVALAILGHELIGRPQPDIDGALIHHLNTVAFQYPEPDC